MHTYRKTYGCSVSFPVEIHDNWNVMERNHLAEHWEVVSKRVFKNSAEFTADITEFRPAN